MVQRDYIERLIQQVAEAVALVLQLSRSGRLTQALHVVHQAISSVLGPDQALLERLEPGSAVRLMGRFELDRFRLYAQLLAEEGTVHDLGGQATDAQRCYRRALDFYAATSLAGARLDAGDRQRIAALVAKVDLERIDDRYRGELRKLAALA